MVKSMLASIHHTVSLLRILFSSVDLTTSAEPNIAPFASHSTFPEVLQAISGALVRTIFSSSLQIAFLSSRSQFSESPWIVSSPIAWPEPATSSVTSHDTIQHPLPPVVFGAATTMLKVPLPAFRAKPKPRPSRYAASSLSLLSTTFPSSAGWTLPLANSSHFSYRLLPLHHSRSQVQCTYYTQTREC